jgi:hypothetical protein
VIRRILTGDGPVTRTTSPVTTRSY